MNRIILIGNGFDKAHNLKTGYDDFINWYWTQWGGRLIHSINKCEDDGLCCFNIKGNNDLPYWSYVFGGYYQRTNPFDPWDLQWVVNTAKQNEELFRFTYKNHFFEEICLSAESKRWFDIENIFYKYLNKTSPHLVDTQTVNYSMDIVRGYLIEYLSEVQTGITGDVVKEEVKEKILAPFSESDISVECLRDEDLGSRFARADLLKKKVKPNRILMLNFNYTGVADLYFENTKHIVNHIHGILSNPSSVIFGYGDELDVNYKNILNTNDNEYLRNIKSIKYLEAPNYRQLLEFIESDLFQIYIMGHSCGNSDRTLLNTLFEHKNCVSIKPFYHKKKDGSDNYIDLVQNISRNFTDMKLMRDRVVNKTSCEPLS